MSSLLVFQLMCYQEGSACSKENTINQLDSQLETLLRGYPSKLDQMQRSSGVKDHYLTMIIEEWDKEVVKKQPKKRGVAAAEWQAKVKILEDLHCATPETFNPLLHVPSKPGYTLPLNILMQTHPCNGF